MMKGEVGLSAVKIPSLVSKMRSRFAVVAVKIRGCDATVGLIAFLVGLENLTKYACLGTRRGFATQATRHETNATNTSLERCRKFAA